MKHSWLSPPALGWQITGLGFAVAPHLLWMPGWLIGLLVVMAGARIQIYRGFWHFPNFWIKAGLMLLLLAALVLSFSRASLMSGTLSLLIGGIALKLVEIHTRRDALVLIYLCYFLIATHFMFEQGILTALYATLATGIVVCAQIALFDLETRHPIRDPVRLAGRMLLPAVPLMLILFLVIPRIGPLWTVPLDQSQAKTGLSSEVSPGDISQLTRSGALAFRVRFDQSAPPPAERYWRALVYSEFDGRTWRLERRRLAGQQLEAVTESERVLSYEVVMEPSFRPWLVALDVPLSVQGAELGGARQIYASKPLDRRIQYRAQSATRYQLDTDLSERDQERYTRFPQDSNPETQLLARQYWADSGGDIDQFVTRVLGLFNERFTYTLQPPQLGANSVDQFLFNTQRGFCSHFSSATALMFRAVGIPARLVGGYLGGEWNPEGYLTVRQYDAHAWIEYFVEGRGWVRLDPTAAVAPERVEQSAETLFADEDGFLADQPLSPLRFTQAGWLFELRQQIDALNFAWHRWVLNYQGQQTQLLNKLLGGLTPLKLALALLIPAAIILAFVAFQLRPRPKPRTPLQKATDRFERALRERGWERASRQPLYETAMSLAKALPDKRPLFEELARVDESVRYGREPKNDTELIVLLNRSSRALRGFGRLQRRSGGQ